MLDPRKARFVVRISSWRDVDYYIIIELSNPILIFQINVASKDYKDQADLITYLVIT